MEDARYELAQEDKVAFLNEQEEQAKKALYRFKLDLAKYAAMKDWPQFVDNNKAQSDIAAKVDEVRTMQQELYTTIDCVLELRDEL